MSIFSDRLIELKVAHNVRQQSITKLLASNATGLVFRNLLCTLVK